MLYDGDFKKQPLDIMDNNKKTQTSGFLLKEGVWLFAKIAAMLNVFLGGLVIFGWYTGNTALIQIMPSFAPMHFNTALCFISAGFALCMLCQGHKPLSRFFGFIVALVAILTLMEYIFNLNLEIDQIFMDAYVNTKTSHPGRMAPNTALSFLLIGLFFMLDTRRKFFSAGLAASALALSVLALIGYLSFTEGLYGWGQVTRMSLHTALGFFVLGLGMLASLKNADGLEKADLWQLTPFSVSIVVVVLTCFAWYSVKETTNAHNQQYFVKLTGEIENALINRYNQYEQSLHGGLGLFYGSDNVSRHEWRAYVNALDIEKNLPGINGVGFVDYVRAENMPEYLAAARQDEKPDFKNHPETAFPDKFIIRYIEPEYKNKEAIGLDIGFESNRRTAAERARDLAAPALTRKIELVQDAQKQAGFLLLLPLYKYRQLPSSVQERRGQFEGWVYAPFMARNFFKGLSDIRDSQIKFKVYDGPIIGEEHLIYNSDPDKENHIERYKSYSQIDVAGSIWTVEWKNDVAFDPPIDDNKPLSILIAGLFFSGLLYYVLTHLILSKEAIAMEVDKRTIELAKSQKELKESLNFQDLIMSRIPDFVFVKDSDLRIVQANDAFLKLYPKHKRHSVIGSTTFEEYDEADREAFTAQDRKALKEGFSEIEETIRFPDGRVRTLMTRKVSFENDHGDRFVLGISRDITEKKKAEEAILRSNSELERYAYIASHDLQEPLRMISNFNLLLKSEYGADMDETANKYMDFSIDATKRMQELVSDLLEYSRLEVEDAIIEDVDCEKQLKVALSDLEQIIKESNAKIEHDKLPHVKGNPMQVSRLFQNLINNALKYKHSDRAPHVYIGFENRHDKYVFSVKDNGIGIKEDYLEQVFVLFKRLHGKEEYGGTGIGLAICKKIVHSMGGEIWAESVYDKGTTFYFSVPKS